MTHQILRTFLIFFHTSAKLWHTCLRTRDSTFILVGLIFWTYVSLVSMDSVSCNHVAVFSLVCSAKFILLPIVIEWMHRHIPKITEITWLFLKFVSCYSYLSHKKTNNTISKHWVVNSYFADKKFVVRDNNPSLEWKKRDFAAIKRLKKAGKV